MNKRRQRVRCLPIVEPMKMRCYECGGDLMVYPYPHPEGTGICETCTPKSDADFVKRMSKDIFAENKKIRQRMGVGADKKELTQQHLGGDSRVKCITIGLPYMKESDRKW